MTIVLSGHCQTFPDPFGDPPELSELMALQSCRISINFRTQGVSILWVIWRQNISKLSCFQICSFDVLTQSRAVPGRDNFGNVQNPDRPESGLFWHHPESGMLWRRQEPFVAARQPA